MAGWHALQIVCSRARVKAERVPPGSNAVQLAVEAIQRRPLLLQCRLTNKGRHLGVEQLRYSVDGTAPTVERHSATCLAGGCPRAGADTASLERSGERPAGRLGLAGVAAVIRHPLAPL